MELNDFKAGEYYFYNNQSSGRQCIDFCILENDMLYLKQVINIANCETWQNESRELSEVYLPYYRQLTDLEKVKYL